MRAVFLPFGSDAAVSANGTSFTFSTTYYAYYLTATLDYTVANNAVSGAFNMMIPDKYVQFYIEDANAADGAYTMGSDAIQPVGVASIAANGNITETSQTAGTDMVGYAYQGGHLFSGKLASWSYGSNYYFAKTKIADNTRADLFVSGKALASHSAVKLPANDSERWITVGENSTVNMGSAGIWYTCNYGSTVPEDLGTLCEFNTAIALTDITLPTKAQADILLKRNGNYTWIALKVHGIEGYVLKDKTGTGFLFFPYVIGKAGYYWTSTTVTSAQAYNILLSGNNNGMVSMSARTGRSYGVRPIQN